MADSFTGSAGRHRSDARHLAADRRFQNAGHLIGFAAECLVKEVLRNAGVSIGRDSPFRRHFPGLGKEIVNDARTRAIMPLQPVIEGGGQFLGGWNVNHRYEASLAEADAESRYLKWQTDVETLFVAVGVP